MAIILDGKKLSGKILEDLERKIKKSGRKLKLAAVLVGKDPNSLIFLRQKEKACKKVGVEFQLYQFPQNISQGKLAEKIKELRYKLCHGIVIQLPLPKHIDAQEILNLIPPKKNIDVFPMSPVVGGIEALLKEYKIELKNKKVAVIGRGRLVGRPVVDWLEKQGIEILDDVKKADILISGVGKPGLIRGKMIKRGAVVIDVAGDVDFKSVFPKASFLTPVPGGVGPMTVVMLLKNLLRLNKISF